MKRLGYLSLLLLGCIIFIGCKREIRQDIVEGTLEALRENGLIVDAPEPQERGDVTYVESAPKPQEQNWVTCELCRGNGRCSECNGSTAYGHCYSCGNIGVCNMCEGEGRYPENTSYFSVHGSKTGLCGVCLGTGRCTSVGCGVDSPLLGPCNACRGTKVCNVCQGKKYCRNVLDYGVKARE